MICVFDSIDMRVLSMQGIYSSDRAEGWKDGNLVSGDSRYIQAQSGTTYKAREDSSIYHHTLLLPTSFYLLGMHDDNTLDDLQWKPNETTYTTSG